MEAHAGAISIGSKQAARPRGRRLAQLRQGIRRRQLRRAERAFSMSASGVHVQAVPGSEHSHLFIRPRGF